LQADAILPTVFAFIRGNSLGSFGRDPFNLAEKGVFRPTPSATS
jgi:hypothetical protein